MKPNRRRGVDVGPVETVAAASVSASGGVMSNLLLMTLLSFAGAAPAGEVQRVEKHFEKVAAILRVQSPPGLSSAQRTRRRDILDYLVTYGRRGRFPHTSRSTTKDASRRPSVGAAGAHSTLS